MAFTDEAVNESAYKTKLKRLKKEEADLLRGYCNIDPRELTEMTALEARISTVRDILNKGILRVTESGIFGEIGDEYVPAGFNAWREYDGELADYLNIPRPSLSREMGIMRDAGIFDFEGACITINDVLKLEESIQ